MFFIENLRVSFINTPANNIVAKVYIRNKKSTEFTLIDTPATIHPDGTIPNFKINNLIDGEIYIVKVEIPGCGSVEKEFNSGTSPAIPDCPQINVTDITEDGFTVGWNHVGTLSYIVSVFEEENTENSLESQLVDGDSFTFADLKPDTDYWLKVEPVGEGGVSNTSCSKTHVKTSSAIPDCPQINVTDIMGNGFTVGWNRVGTLSYTVYVFEEENTENYSEIHVVDGDSFTFAELKPDSDYWTKVEPVVEGGVSTTSCPKTHVKTSI